MAHRSSENSHTLGYGIYILVWFGLIILTGLTVAVSGMDFRAFAVIIPLAIAATKSTLVVNYFMHLHYEAGLFKLLLIITLILLAIFIGLTFTDVLFR